MRHRREDAAMCKTLTSGLRDEANVFAVGVVDAMQLYLVAQRHAGAVALRTGAPTRAVRTLAPDHQVVPEPRLVHRVPRRQLRRRIRGSRREARTAKTEHRIVVFPIFTLKKRRKKKEFAVPLRR